jgi:3',5'-cyclic AMP phosphodiesterase CpdA
MAQMTTVLHLTDLHLDTPEDYAGADFKSDIVPIKDRPDRFTAFQTTLKAITESDWPVDTVVITGDIPFQNGRETNGWELFDSLLDSLGGKLPAANRIIVTPGNHDVAWGKPVGDRAHYAAFIEHVRDHEYTTPMLDQIDFNDSGEVTSSGTHHLLDLDAKLAIVPINSSHYCGALEPLEEPLDEDEWERAVARVRTFDADLAEGIEGAVTALRSQDIARISEPQFKALTSMVTAIREQATDQGVEPTSLVWLAAVHHHLLPVGTDEEFKSYESMTNLGRFRQLLVDLGFDGVLHGHKHSGGVYWDRVHRKGASLGDPDPRLLVISGSTAGSRREGVEEVARLLEIAPASTSRAITISKVPVIDHGGRLPDALGEERAELWRSAMTTERALPQIITGSDVNCVYQRVIALFDGHPGGHLVPDLICEIRSPAGADLPPDGYPIDRVPGGASNAKSWFNETVEWWQRKGSTFQFTHGQRLRAWGPNGIDQVEEVVRLLQSNPTSTRGVITLIDPAIDELAVADRKLPSFSFVHLMIRNFPGGPRKLDCLGFFRKQEMRFWWPINVAELARLQEYVRGRLEQPDLEPGAIVTHSSLAHVGTEVPDVNITLIDRFADGEEDRVWQMAYGVVHPGSVDREAVRNDWLRVIADLRPPDGDESLPRPQLGIRALRECLARFAPPDGSDGLRIHGQLAELENSYDAMAKGAGELPHWRGKVANALEAIASDVDRLLPSDPVGTMEASSNRDESGKSQ